MGDALEFQRRASLSHLLGFDPGPAYSRVMYGLRERILSRHRERVMIKYWAPKIFPEEFKGFNTVEAV